jgi:hypothetical protein
VNKVENTDKYQVCNVVAAMYKQGGEVQLEQWDIYLWLNTTYNAVHG